MSRQKLSPATQSSRARKSRLRRPSSKELDLFVLAGCSCLMTLLYHPVADALQSTGGNPNTASGARAAIAAQVSRTPNQTPPIHFSLPPERDKLKKDDEEA